MKHQLAELSVVLALLLTGCAGATPVADVERSIPMASQAVSATATEAADAQTALPAEQAEDTAAAFDTSDTYADITEAMDRLFTTMEHKYVYDEEDNILWVYAVAPEGWREKLLAGRSNSEVQESWTSVTEAYEDVGDKMRTVLKLSDYPDIAFCLAMVSAFNSSDDYSFDETLYFGMNGETVYNVMTDAESTSSTEKSSGSSEAAENSTLATTGEKNALRKAQDYLDYTAFSYSGLVEQLEYEGFTHSEAVYGADNCGADWYEQAAQKAADYLELMAFSRDSLIEQLEYEGFTYEQAVYGVEQSGY